MQFKEFDWVSCHGIRDIIPCPTNMVGVRISTTAEILKLFSAERINGGRRKSFRGRREDFAK